MKTHFAEATDDVVASNETADDQCWRAHQIKNSQLVGASMILAAAILGLLLFALARDNQTLPDGGGAITAVPASWAAWPGGVRRYRLSAEPDDGVP